MYIIFDDNSDDDDDEYLQYVYQCTVAMLSTLYRLLSQLTFTNIFEALAITVLFKNVESVNNLPIATPIRKL